MVLGLGLGLGQVTPWGLVLELAGGYHPPPLPVVHWVLQESPLRVCCRPVPGVLQLPA